MKPSIGRIVHYVSYGTPGGEYLSRCRAAVVTEVAENPRSDTEESTVGPAVLNPTGLFFRTLAEGGCRQDEQAQKGGTWHRPERVQ